MPKKPAEPEVPFFKINIGSYPFSLSWGDVFKVVKGAIIALASALLVWLTNVAATLDLTTTQGLFIAAALSILINLIRKYISNTNVANR